MSTTPTTADSFLALHQPGTPLLIPNPWDIGSATLLASMGFQALATTSSGFAGTLGRLDGSVTRAEALEHARALVAATPLPVSADLENGFADDPEGVAATISAAAQTGLAGASIEDWGSGPDAALYDGALAVERIAAAAAAATGAGGERRLVLTARAENFLRGNPDLADTIARLQAFQEAGADVLYAPAVSTIDDIRTLIAEVDAPVNVLFRAGGPTVAELADAGAARISVGGSFYFAGVAGVVAAAREFLEEGTGGYWEQAALGGKAARQAFR